MTHLKENLKIFLAIIVSFILVMILSKTIFIVPTPRININFIANLFKPSKNNLPAIAQMTPIAKGIYAKEDPINKTVYLRYTKDVQWNQQVINYNGQQIKLMIPKK